MKDNEMSQYGLHVELDENIATARDRVENALSDHGFGVLTEIDVAATLKKKIGKDIAPQLILGACNPVLADQALSAETSIGLLLPCNVVLRTSAKNRTIVEAVDPSVMVAATGNAALEPIAAEARIALTAALNSLNARRTAVMAPITPRAGRAPAGRNRWPLTRVLFLIAGLVTLLGIALGVTASPWFLLLPAMAGANQLLMVTTGWCPMSLLLTRLGYRNP